MLSRDLATTENFGKDNEKFPDLYFSGLSQALEPWIELANERIFSLAAGKRAGAIAPKLMEIGFSKVLFGADYLGIDIESSNPYILFAPDGTVSYNAERIKRGFAYGALIDFNFDGMIATSNSLPNGCGFSIYEIEEPMDDIDLIRYLNTSQEKIGEDQLSQLGKGNHFAGVYNVIDPQTGEDTNRRWVVVHCSGHVGSDLLYYPKNWLAEETGFHEVPTAHGNVIFLEEEAKNRYVAQFKQTESANSKNRDSTVAEIFDGHGFKRLEEINHQGLRENGSSHIIGAQQHNGIMPIAFNPDEGLIAIKHKPNLSSDFIDTWSEFERLENLNLKYKLSKINITPHGGGYEFKKPVESLRMTLGKTGIELFTIKFRDSYERYDFTNFREIRNHMTYRRRAPVMRKVNEAKLAEIVYELPGLMQIYPPVSIPGGSH